MTFVQNFSRLAVLLLCGMSALTAAADDRIYRMCVPKIYHQDCLDLLKDPSEAGIQMECVVGRDRLDCLEKINRREADVLASEPEDMYVAYHMQNEDFRVISEIRTQDDKDADFRYEGVILVKKDSRIKSLKELRGAKSCHTGFGRNVGYKIPVTKLKNANILKVSLDPEITATERELKALSEFFSESCLVGTYSSYPDTDRLLKKKYPNLCALCEKPEQCNYPDKFSGYDGAIRCLDKGKGEVAFTKVQFIKKYFGMAQGSTAEGNPAQFEYLCEDGSRRPLSGAACSWAQRPWTGYISNADVVKGEELHSLQHRLEKFFENGLHAQNKAAAAHLLINDKAVYHSKPEAVLPDVYLQRAGYKDVIERDGSAIRKMKLCVRTDTEMAKCEAMHRAGYSRDVRPEMECVQENNCLQAVKEGKADMTVVVGHNYGDARSYQLNPLVYESYGDDNIHVVVVTPSLSKADLFAKKVKFDAEDTRATQAAAFFNKRRGLNFCNLISATDDTGVSVVRVKDLEQHKNDQLLCPNLEKQPVTEWRNCNFEASMPRAIFTRGTMTAVEQETIKHLFVELSSRFGQKGKVPDVFTLFGPYNVAKKGADTDVLFDDHAVAFATELQNGELIEQLSNELKCTNLGGAAGHAGLAPQAIRTPA